MTLLLSFPIPGCCKLIGQKNLDLEGVCMGWGVAGGVVVISLALSLWEKRQQSQGLSERWQLGCQLMFMCFVKARL